MKKNVSLSISEFSKATGIKRANLIYYDQIGLLTPDYRLDNNYRRYSRKQADYAFLISALRFIGLSIEEIKEYAINRTPQRMLELFAMQEKRIQLEIDTLRKIKNMMKLQSDITKESMNIDTSEISIVEKQAEPIYLGQMIEKDKSEDEATIEFYEIALTHGYETGYPFGAVIDQATLLSKNISEAKQFYIKLPSSRKDFKPAGRYLIGYTKGGYGESEELYRRLLKYIDEHNLKICGDSYEEYPLNEISTINTDEYLIKLEIRIE